MTGSQRLRRFSAQLKRRKVYRTAALYLTSTIVVWGAADVAVDALGLPAGVMTLIVGGSLALLPVVVVLAWYLEVRPERSDPPAPDPAPPSLSAPGLLRDRRTLLAAAALTLVLGTLWADSRQTEPSGPEDAGTRIAVFPFGTVALDDRELGQGLAELVAVGLDGIPGLNVLDPSALWPPVLQAGLIPLRAEGDQIRQATERFDVDRYVTGTVVQAGSAMDVGVRLFEADGTEVRVFRASASVDSLTHLIDRIIVELVPALLEHGERPAVASIERYSTSDPIALQTYLEAMVLFRAGNLTAAQEAIDEAVLRDSTFALAHVAQFNIHSWLLFRSGQPRVGLAAIVDRAARHQDRLTPRNRWRVAAAQALNRTRGREAAEHLERILEVDPEDLDALETMAYTTNVYGWQFGRGRLDAEQAYDAALAVDSVSLPSLFARTSLALVSGDLTLATELTNRMQRIDPASPLVQDIMTSVELATAPEPDVERIMAGALSTDLRSATGAIMRLRRGDPARAEVWMRTLASDPTRLTIRALGQRALLQLLLAQGALSELADSLEHGPELPDLARNRLLRGVLATEMIGTGESAYTRTALSELAGGVPADSLVALAGTADAWANGWAVGAFHATLGDPGVATAYREGLASLPRGGSATDWPTALALDIDARLAIRDGRADEGLGLARAAYDTWGYHDSSTGEWFPEAAMRFHLADLLRLAGEHREAAALYQSFVYGTWAGFFTPMAALYLGEHLASAGEADEAGHVLDIADALWSGGDPEVVETWLLKVDEARAALRRP